MTAPFHGVKIALICGEELVAYRRDDKPGIPHPGKWDLPGGGREADETPVETALRETEEEFGIQLSPDCVRYSRSYPSIDHPGWSSWFMVGAITPDEVAAIRFESEGEKWALVGIADFLAREDAVVDLRHRLADYLVAGQE